MIHSIWNGRRIWTYLNMNNSVFSNGYFTTNDLITATNTSLAWINGSLAYTTVGTSIVDHREDRIRELEEENQRLKDEIRRYKMNQEY